MAKSTEVRRIEVVAQLLGGLGAVPSVERKRFVLEGLADLVGADAWVWVVQHMSMEGPAYYSIIDGGWENETQKLGCLLSALSPEALFLLEPAVSHPGEHRTYARSELMRDAEWYESDFYLRHREPLKLDDLLLSVYPLGPQVQSVIRYHRRAGRPAFSAADRYLTHLVVGAVDWLHRAGVPLEALPQLDTLPRRAREVLLLLLQGRSRKQVAHELNISEHTVADHSKALHRRFQVRSRGELLAHFIAPQVLGDPTS